MKTRLILLGMLGMTSAAALADNLAAPATAPRAVAVNKASTKAPARKNTPVKHTEPDEDEKEPDTAGSPTTDYHCELGNKLTIYHNAEDDQHIALRWKKRLLRLTRVDTSTGADRFENRRAGLVWINIPAKGMLLDSKKGNQLANECKSPEQMKPIPTGTPSPVES